MEETRVLQKGLKYAPTSNLNTFNIFIDLKKFIRKLTLKRLFAMQENKDKPISTISDCKWKTKSTFFPVQSKGCFIDTFDKVIMGEIKKLEKRNKKKRINT